MGALACAGPCRTALPPRVETALDPFVRGLRRRLGRDQERLHRYHNDLYREAMKRTLALPEEDPKRRREEQRAEAIGREYRANSTTSRANMPRA